MSTSEVDFPRHEITLAKGPYYFAMPFGGAIAAYLISRSIAAIAPGGPWSGPGGRTLVGAALFCVCMIVGLKLLSRADFSKVILTIDHEGVLVAPPFAAAPADNAATLIPWSSIARIRYCVSGRLNETKTIIIAMRDAQQREISIQANLLRCDTTPRDLYETMKRYHRHFAPANEGDDAANGPVYRSASWTGLDDD